MKKIIILLCFGLCFCFPLKAGALSTSAKASILINGATGEVIYESNADEKLPMASTTKIMTALLLCENNNFEREITVTEQMVRVEGSSMGLLAGDKVTLRDLLYGLMLASGNDAANVTAYVLGGSVNGFVSQMNQKAEELNLKDTHFATPSGLDAEGHYTTARDLANLARFAMQNEDFRKAVSCKTAVLNYGNPPYRRSLFNHNKLLGNYENAIGIKTGYTKKSGRCLVSAAEKSGNYVIAVTLNDPNDWADHKAMLEYGLNAIKTTEISPEIKNYKIPVISGSEQELSVKLDSFTVSALDTSDINYTVKLPQFVYAPIKKGEKIGDITYKKGDTVITTTEILSDKDITLCKAKESVFKKIKENYKHIFVNIWEN